MTTFELAERLSRRLKKGHFTALSMAAAMDVVEAINSGLQECYELLPHWQRRTTVSLTLAAPAAVSLNATAGSVDVTSSVDAGDAFDESQIGRSVVVYGDPNWNEVQSVTKLLDDYQGATGVRAATVYGDSVFNDVASFDGFASHPRFAETREELIPFNPRAVARAPEIGKPKYYWTEPAAAALGSTPAVYLRVSPAPDRAYVLRVDLEFRPIIVTYTSLHQASTIPLDVQLLHRALIPLCESRLLRSPEWADPQKEKLVLDDADLARELLTRQRPAASVPANKVFTPAGY